MMSTLYPTAGTVVPYCNKECTYLSAGDVLVVGNLVGVCASEYGYDTEAYMYVTGVFNLSKSAYVFEAGNPVYWDVTTYTACPFKASNCVYIGVAVQDADEDDDVVRILLNHPITN